ncbi:integrase domain-containing protein [Vibrio rarus]|uniref:integrase domain-containing protein n=1 Tax=Vibrio rarus TaxID=413403 RepID=UPI0021C27F1C|nr:integrase domain-containing protein [Vibrio rarus]
MSHINVCMQQARGDSKTKVLATKELDHPQKSGIATVDASVNDALHQRILSKASEPLAVMADLQRQFGLRQREAALLDSAKALGDAMNHGNICVSRGTKGGQPREVACNKEGKYQALQ